MDSHTRIQNTLLNNRVKILKLCDYFTVSAPLIAKRLLPLDTHKEIRRSAMVIQDSKAANTARMDALLDFMDENPTPPVFDAFLEGIKNCESSKQFAKLLKKEGESGGDGGMSMKLPPIHLKSPIQKPIFGVVKPRTPTPSNSAIPNYQNSIFGGNAMVNGPSTFPIGFSFGNTGAFTTTTAYVPQTVSPLAYGGQPVRPIPTNIITTGHSPTQVIASAPAPKKKANKKPKPKVPNGPPTSSGSASTDVFAFNPNANPAPVVPKPRTPRPSKKKPKEKEPVQKKTELVKGNAGQSTASPVTNSGTGSTPVQVKKEKKPAVKRVYPSKTNPKQVSKVVTPGPSLTANLVYIKPEAGTSKLPTDIKPKGFTTKVPAGSPFRPKNGVSKAQQHAKPMTFQEAEAKQKSTTRGSGFNFLNSEAIVKKIDFNNKSDLFYEGCPTKEGNYLCTRKVQLKGKGKKYVCKEKHENEAYELFPRLYVTFKDSTAEMEATVYRENVEILAGKSVSEMHTMNDVALSTEFAKAIGMNIPIRVTSEKVLKKDLKHAGGKTWNNVAHIITETGNQSGPPAKKAKKAAD